VLVQNSKGGGLAAGFSSSNQIMGVRRTADFLEKATWTLAGVLLFLCLSASIIVPKVMNDNRKSAIQDKVNAQDPTATPAFPQPQKSNNSSTTPAPAPAPTEKK
jgi:preprotein translocase subunit SecG